MLNIKKLFIKILTTMLRKEDLVSQTFTKTIGETIAANTTKSITIDITKSGYTALGIVSFWGSGTGSLNWADWYLLDSVTASLWCRNNTSSDITLNSVNIKVLFKKN